MNNIPASLKILKFNYLKEIQKAYDFFIITTEIISRPVFCFMNPKHATEAILYINNFNYFIRCIFIPKYILESINVF